MREIGDGLRERREEREKLRAAVEGEALERGSDFFGLGAAPLGGPLRLRYEHPIFAVLFLPHSALKISQSKLGFRRVLPIQLQKLSL